MGWTAPRTFVSGEVLTAAIFNTHLRDNLLFLGTHGHSGAAGDGTGDLSGLDSIGWEDAAGDPGVVGTLQRNGSSLAYHDGTGVVVVGGVAAAGTPSARALGSSDGTQGANGTHLHTLIEQVLGFNTNTSGTAATVSNLLSEGPGTVKTVSQVFTATGTSRLVGYGVLLIDNSTGTGSLVLDGTTFSATIWNAAGNRPLITFISSKVVGSGTYTISMTARPTNGSALMAIGVGGLVAAIGTPA